MYEASNRKRCRNNFLSDVTRVDDYLACGIEQHFLKYMIKNSSHVSLYKNDQNELSRVVRKPTFCMYAKTKTQISLAVAA